MVDFKIKYQAGIFIDAKEIVPDAKNITNLVNEFSDYDLVPNTIQEISSQGQHARVSMKSQDGEWEIRFGTQRVNIEKNPTDPKGENLGSISDFATEVNDLTEKIFDLIDKKSNRLSLLSRYFLKDMDENRLNEVYSTIFNSTEFYKENLPVEWNSRIASRVNRDINGMSETLNFIYELNRIQGSLQRSGNVQKLDRLELKTDINTYQNNTDPRFVFDNAIAFFSNAAQWEDNLKNEVLSFISNE